MQIKATKYKTKKIYLIVLLVISFGIFALIFAYRHYSPTISCSEIKEDFQKIFGVKFIQNPNSIEYIQSGKHQDDLYCDIYTDLSGVNGATVNDMIKSYVEKNHWIVSKTSTWSLGGSNIDYKKDNVRANIVVSWNDQDLCINTSIEACALNIDKNKLVYTISVGLRNRIGPIRYID